MSKKLHVHFIGVNGSGCSGVAIIAKNLGFTVSGCDLAASTPYSGQVQEAGIKVINKHDIDHVNDADIVAVSPALILQKSNIDEVEYARVSGKLMRWQDFLGEHILPGKRVIAICGTHGKTTTSALVAHIMEESGLDPSALIGAMVPKWGSSNRLGRSDWLVLEADEYANNFESYRPEIAILNNLEMEHPEYFKDWEHYKKAFIDFLQNAKTVIYNADDSGVLQVLDKIPGRKIPFSVKEFPNWPINIIGNHNRSNAMAAVALARTIGIDDPVTRSAVATFDGVGHRLEKIYDDKNLIIFDDYAHHHTQVKNTIETIKENYPDHKTIVVYEPHQISRYKQNTKDTMDILGLADLSIIVAFHCGRERHLQIPDVESDINKFGADNVRFIPDFEMAVRAVKKEISGKTVVIVMGAGKSYQISGMVKKSCGVPE